MEEMQLSDIDENNHKQDTPSTGDIDEQTYLDVPLLPQEN
jgi:hypothetical protein